MNDFADSLRSIASSGERQYARVDAPAGHSAAFVKRARGEQRARVALQAGAGALAVAAVAFLGMQTLGKPPTDPAVSLTPGEPVWSVDLGAESWSSPVVVDGVAVAGANDGEIQAVSVADGTELWTFATGADVRSAVTANGTTLYALSDDGSLYSLTAEGDLLWSADVGNQVAARDVYDVFSSAPLTVGSAVMVASHDGAVYSLDAGTGDVRWRFETQGPVSADLAYANGTVFVASSDSNLYAINSDTGAEQWRAGMGNVVMSSPAVAGGVVVSGSRGTFVRGFDAATGEMLWENRMPGGGWAEANVEINGDRAYYGSSNSAVVTAVDLATGEVIWRSNVGGWPWAKPVYSDGVVYATSGRGAMAQPWEWAVFAIDAQTGGRVWTQGAGKALEWWPEEGGAYGVMTSPAVADDVVIVVGLDGVMRAFAR